MAQSKNLLLILVCCVTVVSVVALVLGAISLSQTNVARVINVYTQVTGDSQSGKGEDRVWTFAIGHLQNNIEYLDPVTYQIKGYVPDVIDAVCSIANKNCELVWDIYSNCWDSKVGQRARGGHGLMSGWYDACSGWTQSFNRLLTFGFSTPIRQVGAVAFYVRNDSTISYTDVTGRKFGFLDGWFTDEFCVARYGSDGITGVDLTTDQITHYGSGQELADAVINGDVDIAFTTHIPEIVGNLKRITPDNFPTRCAAGGPSMMTQKRNVEFVRWWNEGFGRLVGTRRYRELCQNVLEEHGDYPGHHPDELCIGM